MKRLRKLSALIIVALLLANSIVLPVTASGNNFDEMPEESEVTEAETSEPEITEPETIESETSEPEMRESTDTSEMTESDEAVETIEEEHESLGAAGDVVINSTNFPDENFRNYISENCDTYKDGILSVAEISAVTELNCDGISVSSLTGVGVFKSLEYLYCGNNSLETLDVSQNTNLLGLECTGNLLTGLDISNNTKLVFLTCDYNKISTLTLGSLTKPEEIYCANNRLVSLDLSHCTTLKKLDCSENRLTNLDVSSCSQLEDLSCSANKLTSLILGTNSNLTWLYCNNNQLVNLDVSGCVSVKCIDCSTNNLKSFDVRNNKAISMLYCTDEIGSIDISNNPYLIKVYKEGENYDGYHTMFDENGEMIELALSPNVTVITDKPIIYPNGIGFNYDSMLIVVGEVRSIVVTVVPDNATDKSVTWNNTNPQVVGFSNDGTVIAKSVGKTTISATTVNGLKKECVVTVLSEINPNNPFADVESGGWKYSAARYVYDNGYMVGKGELIPGKVIFSPNTPINRSEFVQMLYNVEKKPAVAYQSRFLDVPEGQWYSLPITWASQKGIVAGYKNGYFGVKNVATREQVAMMFYSYAKYKGYDTSVVAGKGKRVNDFPDSGSVSDWAVTPLNWALSHGILSGRGTGVLDPRGSATRVECATMLRNFMNEFGTVQ